MGTSCDPNFHPVFVPPSTNHYEWLLKARLSSRPWEGEETDQRREKKLQTGVMWLTLEEQIVVSRQSGQKGTKASEGFAHCGAGLESGPSWDHERFLQENPSRTCLGGGVQFWLWPQPLVRRPVSLLPSLCWLSFMYSKTALTLEYASLSLAARTRFYVCILKPKDWISFGPMTNQWILRV